MAESEISVLKRALARERAARKQAEEILELKSAEIYAINQRLNESNKYLESLLTKTDSQLQGVFENIADAYVIIDLYGNILKMNDPAVKLLGFKTVNDDFNLMETVIPEEVPYVRSSFKNLLKKGSVTDVEIKIRTQQGHIKIVHMNASIIYDNDIAVAAQGIVRDITVESTYKTRLVTEKQKYYNIISNMNLGLVEVDMNNRIVMTNQSFVNMTGYSKKELIGKRGNDFLPIEEDIALSEKKLKERKRNKIKSYELRIKKKKGEIRHWLVSGAPNYDIEGNVVGSIGINFDISEIKNLQLQKENLLSQLEKNNDELQEYAHIVSHDLKSPLRSIDALIQWIKEDNEGKLDESTLMNFSHIETTLEKMEQLISDILSYSSAGVDNREKTEVDTNELVEDLISILYIPEHIEVTIKKKLPILNGDKTKLQQLFQNLISNAVKFIDKEKGLVQVKCLERSTFYQFSVSDNGMGIEKRFHDKIFKIFHSLNKSKESTGIGLSIVKKIVDLHEGKLWLESEPGKGTTFHFTLRR
jgi:PAS domain S-box-containing protein